MTLNFFSSKEVKMEKTSTMLIPLMWPAWSNSSSVSCQILSSPHAFMTPSSSATRWSQSMPVCQPSCYYVTYYHGNILAPFGLPCASCEKLLTKRKWTKWTFLILPCVWRLIYYIQTLEMTRWIPMKVSCCKYRRVLCNTWSPMRRVSAWFLTACMRGQRWCCHVLHRRMSWKKVMPGCVMRVIPTRRKKAKRRGVDLSKVVFNFSMKYELVKCNILN